MIDKVDQINKIQTSYASQIKVASRYELIG